MLRNVISVIKAGAGCLLWLSEKSINHLQSCSKRQWLFFHCSFLGQIMCTVNIHIQRFWNLYMWWHWFCALYSHIKYEITSHLYGKNRGNVSAKNTHCIFMNTLCFIFPFPMSEKSFTRAVHALTNYSAPMLLGIRRRWHGCVQEEHEWIRGRHLLSLLGQVWNGSPSEERTRWLWHVRLSEGK